MAPSAVPAASPAEADLRWSTAEVLALAPDPGVALAARGLATPTTWSALGSDDVGVWGLYRGTSAEPYDVSVDRTGPAWRCSCPSRKIPCKHAIGLLLLWAEGNVPVTVRPGPVAGWLAARAQRVATAESGTAAPAPTLPFEPGGPEVSTPRSGVPPVDRARDKRADERAQRVRAGLRELDRWLADQVRRGVAAPELADLAVWEAVAARLVDAQAAALANRVRRVTELVGQGTGWQERVLQEMATLHTLAVAGQRLHTLDEDLATSVRTAVGWTVSKEDVLSCPPVTDHWHAVGRSDTEEHRITVRRTWLLGRDSGRWALLLSFAAFGQTLVDHPPVGSILHADVHHFPGRVPIRALLGVEHAPAEADREGPREATVEAAVAEAGWALASEPWLERWPAVVRATPARRGEGWVLADDTGAMALVADHGLVNLLAVSGGHPVVVAGEHRADGFLPCAVRANGRGVALR